MAGIFSIFSETENNSSISSNNGKEKTHSILAVKSRSIGNVGLPAKSFVQPQIKPKGLSIRSKSDLNVPISNQSGSNKLNLNECLKLDIQCTPHKQSVSPIKLKTPKSKSCINIASKKLSPKISSPIMQNVVDDFVFTKPATPKESKKLKIHPEPEKMSYSFDPYDYINKEVETIFEADRNWLRTVTSSACQLNDSKVSLEDEGFISDPEHDSLEIPISSPLPSLELLEDIELPEISDCED